MTSRRKITTSYNLRIREISTIQCLIELRSMHFIQETLKLLFCRGFGREYSMADHSVYKNFLCYYSYYSYYSYWTAKKKKEKKRKKKRKRKRSSVFAFLFVCLYVCGYVGMWVCEYVCMFVCVYVCMFVCVFLRNYWTDFDKILTQDR